jgi:PKD repeat protein
MNTGDTDAEVIQFDETYGINFPSVSGIEGGGNAVNSDYQIPAYPTVILIAPDRSIVIQDIWPIPNAQTIINALEAFGIEENTCGGSILTADFEADLTDPCLNGQVQFSNNSLGDVVSYSWIFEGGTPETSDQENPLVIYETPGDYDVSLTVSDGNDENTLLKENFISVNEIQAAFEADNTDICDGEMVVFTSSVDCAEEIMWMFDGGIPETSTEANPTITYPTAGVYSVSLTALNGDNELEVLEEAYITVHNCTGTSSISNNKMSISPNPNNGYFKITLPGSEVFEIQVFDMTGQLVHSENRAADVQQIDISHLENGIYMMTVKNSSIQLKSRILIEK